MLVDLVTNRRSNPFGMRAPCPTKCSEEVSAVYGYGDVNADFHIIGDNPNRHGGKRTGIPFTDSIWGEAVQSILLATGFMKDEPSQRPTLRNCYMSYLYMCCPAETAPTASEYDRLERFFDAELRAINAHILFPVGERVTRRIVRSYTTQAEKLPTAMVDLHATEIRGRGVLVVPILDPRNLDSDTRTEIVELITDIKQSDYRQTKGVATYVG